MNSAIVILTLTLGTLYVITRLSRVGQRPPDLPPGPPTIPVLGNLHLMPSKNQHLQFEKWAREYGPIYSLILGTKTMIVLSSDTAVKDLLDRKSNNYSDRPDMYLAQNIASGGLRVVLMKYGEKWRMIHRIIHNILNIKAAITYVPYQDLENKMMLVGLIDSPNEFHKHLRRYTFSLSTQIIFGFRCDDLYDSRLQQLFWGFSRWAELAASVSAQIVDLFPFMQKLPKMLAPNVLYAEKLFQKERNLYTGLWMDAKHKVKTGTAPPCFCHDLLRAQTAEDFSDDLAGYISCSLLEAGSDTTASILNGFIQAMLVWPEVQAKAREEIDRVIGFQRLPTIEDYPNLPYIRCCIKESLRWMPTVILGAPHAALKEDRYMDYRIPAGATIINNVWAIHMDPARSPDPRRFNPDRFAGDQKTLYESAIGDEKQRDNFVFGAGRRLCQGIHIAERSLFLGVSRIIWGFTLSPALDAAGNSVTYEIHDLVGGLTVEPKSYSCLIEPRSIEKANLMRSAAEECKALLNPETGQWSKPPQGMAFSTWVPETTYV